MANDVILFMQGFFAQMWRLFTSWEMPGLGFSPAQLYFFILVAPIAVKIVKSIVTLSVDSLASGARSSGRRKKGDK